MSFASKGYVNSVVDEGGGSSSGIFVGVVTKGSSFPTRRLDGSPLQVEDFVKVDTNTPDSDFPFTISGVTFNNRRDQAFHIGSNRWQIDPGVIQTTSETPTTNKTAESLNEQGTTQAQVNLQVANMIGKKKSVAVANKENILDALNFAWEELQKAGFTFTLTNTDSDSIRDIKLTVKDYNDNVLLEEELKDFIIKTRKVAGYDLADDITAQEIQDAIKNINAILTNKTINADDNTITNIEIDNFKSGVVRTSIREEGQASNNNLATEKAIRDAIIEAVAGLFKIKGNKETEAEILALTGSEDYEAWICEDNGKLYYWLTDRWLSFLLLDVNQFVKKIETPNSVYGTDENGEQKLYSIDDIGKVQDVTVNNVSVVVDNIAKITVPTDEEIEALVEDMEAVPSWANDTPYTSSPANSDTLANVDLSTKKVKKITFANLWTWILTKISGICEKGIQVSDGKLGISNSITAGTKGSTIAIPKITYNAQGLITDVAEQTVYPPTTAGTSGQYWKSDGSGQGVWTTPSTSITSSSTNAQIPSAKAVYDALAAKTDWTYIGILGAATGSTITVKDDWNELLFMCRVTEGSNVYNLTSVMPKLGFTQGSPTNNTTFIGFTWNSSYYVSVRISLTGTGDSRQVKVAYTNQNGWNNNGIYVYKK